MSASFGFSWRRFVGGASLLAMSACGSECLGPYDDGLGGAGGEGATGATGGSAGSSPQGGTGGSGDTACDAACADVESLYVDVGCTFEVCDCLVGCGAALDALVACIASDTSSCSCNAANEIDCTDDARCAAESDAFDACGL